MNLKELWLLLFYRVVSLPFKIFPVDHKLILFEAYYGKGFEDSPSEIAKELHDRYKNDIKLAWLVRDIHAAKTLPSFITPVRRFSLKELYYLSCSHIWIDNCRKMRGIKKRKNQFYIQTWHGGIGSKKVEKQVADILSNGYIKNAINDSNMADLFLSGSRWQTKLYRDAFWYSGEILERGLPRNDIFFRDSCEIKKKVRDFYNINGNKHIVVYAPTFRDSDDTKWLDLKFDKLITNLGKYWGGEWIVIVRMHPSALSLQSIIKYSDTIKNGSVYPEMNELTIASDVLISDYSSCIFDAILNQHRVIRYVPDIDRYKQLRGTNLDEEDLPFPTAYNNDQIERILREYDYQAEVIKQKLFLEKVGSAEIGCASKAVVERISELL